MRDLYQAPYLYIHRADLHSVLITALEETGRATVRLGASVESASASADEATVQLRSGETVTGDIVIGADGVKSPIRRLFEPASPHFTGHVAWRAMIPVEGSGLDDLAALRPCISEKIGRCSRYPHRPGQDGRALSYKPWRTVEFRLLCSPKRLGA